MRRGKVGDPASREWGERRIPGPLGAAIGFAAAIAVTLLSWLVGAGSDARIGLVLLTLTAIVVGACTTVPGAIGAGVLCWAFYSGFVLDRFGVLTFARGGGHAFALIVLAAMAASVVATALRLVRAIAADSRTDLVPLQWSAPGHVGDGQGRRSPDPWPIRLHRPAAR